MSETDGTFEFIVHVQAHPRLSIFVMIDWKKAE